MLKSPPAYLPSPTSQIDDCPSNSPSALSMTNWCEEIRQQEFDDRATLDVVKTEELDPAKTVLSSLVPIFLEKAFVLAKNKRRRNNGDVIIVLPSFWCIQCFFYEVTPFLFDFCLYPQVLVYLENVYGLVLHRFHCCILSIDCS
jgi:hypothetical protein